jgi:hypothetical protein
MRKGKDPNPGSDPDPYLSLMNPGPDPGGQKTCKSSGSGSGSPTLLVSFFINYIAGEEDTMASQLRFHGLELGLQPLPTFHLVLPYSHITGWFFLINLSE